ncbi:MAG: hypothetical protein M3083_10425, partial [Actinomycetota bacterium]|nr:hypothetical protein [Actinomycetota bacterium]
IPPGGQVLVSGTYQGGWQLSVAGHRATRQRAFGWAMLFTAPKSGGRASLHFVTPIAGRGLLVLEVALWFGAVAALVADRRRRRGAPGGPGDQPPASTEPVTEPPLPLLVGAASHRRARRVTVPDTGGDDEMWT